MLDVSCLLDAVSHFDALTTQAHLVVQFNAWGVKVWARARCKVLNGVTSVLPQLHRVRDAPANAAHERQRLDHRNVLSLFRRTSPIWGFVASV